MREVKYHKIITIICIFIIILIIFLPLMTPSKKLGPSNLGDCKNNLSELSAFLIFYNNNNSSLAQTDVMSSKYSNWGNITIAYYQESTDLEKLNDYLICPMVEQHKETTYGINDYWWADLSNRECFPKHRLGPSIDPKTPIAGDAPDNHEPAHPPNLLLMNGEVTKAKKNSKLWEKAYGSGGCLQPPRSN